MGEVRHIQSSEETAWTNVLTSRFVAKWKIVEDVIGKKTRIIRMRLVLRGFQDYFAHLRERYSGTASRNSQKLLCSRCACMPGFIVATFDIEKAFLQGMTVQEVSGATGTAEEETRCITVWLCIHSPQAPPPGYETLDDRSEVRLALNASTGTVAAPRAFSLKLAKITQGPPFHPKPSSRDPEVEV